MLSYPTASQSRRYMAPRKCARVQSTGTQGHSLGSATTGFRAVEDAVDFGTVEMNARAPFETDQGAGPATGARHAADVAGGQRCLA